jgi:hypothetical protein
MLLTMTTERPDSAGSDNSPSQPATPHLQVPADERPARKRRALVIAAAGTVFVLIAAAALVLLLTRPWATSCVADDHHVIDPNLDVCYVIPDGWQRYSLDELANAAAYGSSFSSAISVPETETSYEILTFVSVAEVASGETPSSFARDASQGNFQDGSVHTELDERTIDGHRAVTAVSTGRAEPFDDTTNAYPLSQTTTIVTIGERHVVIMSSAVGADKNGQTIDNQDVIDAIAEIHDSISVAS